MAEQGLENLLRSNEEDLARIRQRLFPALVERAITGYNLNYNSVAYDPEKICLSYFHAHTGHILSLAEMLQQDLNLPNGLVSRQNFRERYATYLTDPNWDTQLGIRYFDRLGREKSRWEVPSNSRDIIVGEAVQNDWTLEFDSKKDLRKAIGFFKKYASKGRIDKKGRVIRDKVGKLMKNKFAVADSWEVPLLTISGDGDNKGRAFSDFSSVFEVTLVDMVGATPVVISTICKKDKAEMMEAMYPGQVVSVREKYLINECYSWMG